MSRGLLDKAMAMWAYSENEKAAECLAKIDAQAMDGLMWLPWLDAAWWLPGWGQMVHGHAPKLFEKIKPMGVAWLSDKAMWPLAAGRPELVAQVQNELGLLAVDSGWPLGENVEIHAGWFPSNISRLVLGILEKGGGDPTAEDYAAAREFLAWAKVDPSEAFDEGEANARKGEED